MEAINEDGSYDASSVRQTVEVVDSGYTYFEQGDVVRARVTPCFENGKGALLSDLHGGCGFGTTELFVFAPSRQVDPRYLYYVTVSREFTEMGTATLYGAHGVRRVDQEFAHDYQVWLPPRSTQTAIADYLDRETVRIDALIAAKRKIMALLEERFWTQVDHTIAASTDAYLPLRRYVRHLVDGPFGSSLTSGDYSESGARVVRLGNIGRGCFRDNDRVYISLDYFNHLLSHRVIPGDLLIAGLGDTNNHVGRACVAPDLGPAIVKADCYCASVSVDRASAAFLALYLSSPLGARHVAAAARGTTRSRINLDIAREIQVPSLPPAAQNEILLRAANERRRKDQLSARLERQTQLLQEHRQALITIAVTGQLDISKREPAVTA